MRIVFFLIVLILFVGVSSARQAQLVPFDKMSVDQHSVELYEIMDGIVSNFPESWKSQRFDHGGDFAARSNDSQTYVQSFIAPFEERIDQTGYRMGIVHVSDVGNSSWAIGLEGACALGSYASVLMEESGVVLATDGLYMVLLVEGLDGDWVANKMYVMYLNYMGTAHCLGAILIDEYYDGMGAYARTFYSMNESAEVAVSKIEDNTLYIDRTITLGNRTSGFTFTETYTAEPDSLFISQSTRPEYFISQAKADSIYQDLLLDYYGAYWDSVASEEWGSSNRALSFLYRFGDLSVLRPDFAPGHYNTACMLAILENYGQAIQFLEKAILLDPDYLDKARRDPDLKGLRESKKFKRLFGQ